MNGGHLRAFIWLRWRLLVNQQKRSGIVNKVLLALLAASVAVAAIGLFVGLFLTGWLALPRGSFRAVLFAWDGLVVLFLVFWAASLLAELQRSEPLSLDKFLHLPVSVTGAFLLNYLSSLFSVTLVLFLAGAVGLILGLVVANGPALLLLFPLLAAFVLALTAVTYQFQGWLASLMVNPRRGRTIIAVMTTVCVLSCQLPNLLNVLRPWDSLEKERVADEGRLREAETALVVSLQKKQVTHAEYQKRVEALRREHLARTAERSRRNLAGLDRYARLGNLALPPGWLPLGAADAVEGNLTSALLGTAALTLIGVGSLWRAHRTTLRLYTGHYTAEKGRKAVPPTAEVAPALVANAPPGRGLLDRRLPGVSEQAQAIALGGFLALFRAPEARMMLLAPLILAALFGSFLFTGSVTLPLAVRPLLPLAGMGMVLFSMLQVAGNQFGFDRAGFRIFVLCPAPRREVLLGKNLAFAPMALIWGVILLAVLQILHPMRWDHLLAAMPQMLSMYLLFQLMANLLSILAPIALAAGGFKPTSPRLVVLLLHVVFFFLYPVVLVPSLLPLGIEYAVGELAGVRGIPISLMLSLILGVGVVLFYRVALGWEGDLLQVREQHILTVVTSKE